MSEVRACYPIQADSHLYIFIVDSTARIIIWIIFLQQIKNVLLAVCIGKLYINGAVYYLHIIFK